MSNKHVSYLLVVAVLLFIASRFLFLANYPHFFDSPEYVNLAQSINLEIAFQNSHLPTHPIYIFLLVLTKGAPVMLSALSAVFGLLTFIAFYLIVKNLFNKEVAVFSLFPLVVFFHSWLVQTNVMHEALDHFLLILGLLFWLLYLRKNRLRFLLLSLTALLLTFFNFLGMLIWAPVFLAVTLLKSPRKQVARNIIVVALLVFSAATVAYLLTILFNQIFSLATAKGVAELFSGFGTKVLLSWSLVDIIRVLRNSLYIAYYGYSPYLILVVVGSLVYFIYKKKYKELFILAFLLLPFYLTGKFWYGGFMGRYNNFAAYIFAILFAYIKPRKLYFAVMLATLIFFYPAVAAYKKTPVPKTQSKLIEYEQIKADAKLIIISDYQRPQLEYENILNKNYAVILDNDKANKNTIIKINNALANNQTVLITKQAITFPYFQYEGQTISPLSVGNVNKAKLYSFLKKKKLLKVNSNSSNTWLDIYKIRN